MIGENVPNDQLSPVEEDLIDQVFAEFGALTRWQLVEYTHTLPEWTDPHGSSVPIRLREVLSAQGISEDDADAILGDLCSAEIAAKATG